MGMIRVAPKIRAIQFYGMRDLEKGLYEGDRDFWLYDISLSRHYRTQKWEYDPARADNHLFAYERKEAELQRRAELEREREAQRQRHPESDRGGGGDHGFVPAGDDEAHSPQHPHHGHRAEHQAPYGHADLPAAREAAPLVVHAGEDRGRQVLRRRHRVVGVAAERLGQRLRQCQGAVQKRPALRAAGHVSVDDGVVEFSPLAVDARRQRRLDLFVANHA